MTDKQDAIHRIADAIIKGIQTRKSVVVFVRCGGPETIQDASTTLAAFSSHVKWIDCSPSAATPIEDMRAKASNDRTVLLIPALEERTLESLEAEREAFNKARIRAVFLLTTPDIRMYDRHAPSFWRKRDCFTAWPVNEPETTEGEGTEEDDKPSTSYEEGARKSINRRVDNALNMKPGYARGKAIFTACRDSFLSGDPKIASKHMVAAINELRKEGRPEEVAEAFQILGSVAEQRGDLRAASDWFTEALNSWYESGSPEGLAGVYARLGALCYRVDDLDNAQKYLTQALEIEEPLQNPVRLCDAYRHVGMVKERLDLLTDAEECYLRAEKMAEKAGDHVRLAKAVHHQGRIQELRERWEDARDLYNRALTLKEQHGDLEGMAATYHQLGIVHYRRAEHDIAVSYLQKAIGIEENYDDLHGLASTLLQLGLVAEERFLHDVAYKSLYRARPMLRKLHSPLIPELEKRLTRMSKLMTIKEQARLQEEIVIDEEERTGVRPEIEREMFGEEAPDGNKSVDKKKTSPDGEAKDTSESIDTASAKKGSEETPQKPPRPAASDDSSEGAGLGFGMGGDFAAELEAFRKKRIESD
jgi:tetratricopeptide (TPR) repeat protein